MPTKKQIDRAIDRLYKAVQHYVDVRGGSIAVIGGIQIQEWPQDNKFTFRVAVKCTGRKPEIPQETSNGE